MPQATPDPHRAAPMKTAGKLGVAVLVFLTIMSGAVLFQRWQARAVMVLPGVETSTRCSIWFIGSSTIHKWRTLRADMRPWDAHNRGIDGARIPDLTNALGHEPPAHRPAAIVLYAGENDIARGGSSEKTIAALKDFLAVRTPALRGVPILLIGMKPSPGRWANRPEQLAFNRMARDIVASTPGMAFVDPAPMLLVSQRPGPFYVADGIHLNAAGYARLAAVIRPALQPLHVPPCPTMD